MYPQRCGAAKPDAAIFAAALGELGIEAREAIYLGDDPRKDLAAARDAGLSVLPVESSGLSELPARIEAIATFDPRSPETT